MVSELKQSSGAEQDWDTAARRTPCFWTRARPQLVPGNQQMVRRVQHQFVVFDADDEV